MPALDAPAAAAWWRDQARRAPAEIDADVQLLGVVANQIDLLGDDAGFGDVAALVLTPRVAAAHRRVVADLRERCGIVVADAVGRGDDTAR